jgi:hypothetical protein
VTKLSTSSVYGEEVNIIGRYRVVGVTRLLSMELRSPSELAAENSRLVSENQRLKAEIEKRKLTIVDLAQSNLRLADTVEKLTADVKHYKQLSQQTHVQTMTVTASYTRHKQLIGARKRRAPMRFRRDNDYECACSLCR